MSLSGAELQGQLAQGRDIYFFAEHILGVKLNPAQRRWFMYVARLQDNGWGWAFNHSAHVSANQTGKTLGMGIFLLWAALYKIGVPFEATDASMRAWLDSPYLWIHLGPKQNQAYHVLSDIRMLIKGAHPAQEKGRREWGLKYILPAGLAWEGTVESYYDGLYFLNGAVIQFRTSEDKAKAILGYRAHGISFDEAAFENHLNTIISEVLLMRLISTGGPLVMISTPNGINDFFEVVEDIRLHGKRIALGEAISELVWVTTDGRALIYSTIEDNIGFGFTQTEVDRMEEALDPATKEQQLRGIFLEPTEAFFRPAASIIRAFSPKLPDKMLPKALHRYTVGWDPSVSSDPTAGIILDVTRRPWVGVEMVHERKPQGVDHLLTQMWERHNFYNGAVDDMGRTSSAITGYDSTSMGGAMIRQSLRGLTPQRAFNFGGTSKTKRDMLVNLRAVLVKGHLVLPAYWVNVQRELLNYRLEDKSISQDLVMALAISVALASSTFSTGTRSVPFSPHARVTSWRTNAPRPH